MPYLPVRPDLDQLRHQAKDLLHAAQRGDPDAVARIRAVSDRIMLSAAQLAAGTRHLICATWNVRSRSGRETTEAAAC